MEKHIELLKEILRVLENVSRSNDTIEIYNLSKDLNEYISTYTPEPTFSNGKETYSMKEALRISLRQCLDSTSNTSAYDDHRDQSIHILESLAKVDTDVEVGKCDICGEIHYHVNGSDVTHQDRESTMIRSGKNSLTGEAIDFCNDCYTKDSNRFSNALNSNDQGGYIYTPVKELTVKEIEKLLGYSIKVVE